MFEMKKKNLLKVTAWTITSIYENLDPVGRVWFVVFDTVCFTDLDKLNLSRYCGSILSQFLILPQLPQKNGACLKSGQN